MKQENYPKSIKKFFLALTSNRIKNFLSFILIGIVISLLVFSLINQKEILKTIEWAINFKYLFLTIGTYLFALYIIFFAWYLMMKQLGYKEKIKHHLLVFSKSIVARRIPLPIWFVGSRFYFYKNSEDQKSKIATATVFEIMLSGLSGLLFFFIIAAIYFSKFFIWVFLVIYLFLLILVFNSKKLQLIIMKLIKKIFYRESILNSIPTLDIWKWFLLYEISWILAGFTFFFGIKAVIFIELNLVFILLISAISGLVGFFSMLLPAGFGLKEITAGLLLTQSFPFGVGLLLGIINRFFTTVVEVLWSLTIMIIHRNNP